MPDNCRYCVSYLAVRGLTPADYEWQVTIIPDADSPEQAADQVRQNTPDLDLKTAMRVTPLDDDLGGLYITDMTDVDGIIMREVEEDDDGEYYLV